MSCRVVPHELKISTLMFERAQRDNNLTLYVLQSMDDVLMMCLVWVFQFQTRPEDKIIYHIMSFFFIVVPHDMLVLIVSNFHRVRLVKQQQEFSHPVMSWSCFLYLDRTRPWTLNIDEIQIRKMRLNIMSCLGISLVEWSLVYCWCVYFHYLPNGHSCIGRAWQGEFHFHSLLCTICSWENDKSI